MFNNKIVFCSAKLVWRQYLCLMIIMAQENRWEAGIPVIVSVNLCRQVFASFANLYMRLG